GVERFAVARDERLHDRVIRRIGLDKAAALLPYPPGAPGHLCQELPGAFGGAWVAVRQAESGIDYADKRKAGKVVALCDELRADDDIHLAARDRIEFGADPLRAAQHVARHGETACGGKTVRHLLLQPLDTGTDRDQCLLRSATRARFGPSFLVAAMMADQD